MGVAARWRSGVVRGLGIAAGVLSIGFAFLVIALPGLGLATLVLFLYLGLIVFGAAEIGVGMGARLIRGWMRGYFVAVGVLNLVLAPLTLFMPGFARLTLVLILSLVLVVNGIELAVSGMVGRFHIFGTAARAPTGRGPVS